MKTKNNKHIHVLCRLCEDRSLKRLECWRQTDIHKSTRLLLF